MNTAATTTYHVVRVNGNPKDTYAALTYDEALELAMPDSGSRMEHWTVLALDAGAARLMPLPHGSTVERSVAPRVPRGWAFAGSVLLSMALLVPGGLHAATAKPGAGTDKPATPAAKCERITVNGATVWAKATKSGWSMAACEPKITLQVGAVGAKGVQGTGFEVAGKVTAQRCTVKVDPDVLTNASRLSHAVQACVDAMQHVSEVEVGTDTGK